MRIVLAESANFVVEHEYELAFARDKRSGREVHLGSHYGDPTSAVIASDETWFAVGGEGVTGFHRTFGEFSLLRDASSVEIRVTYDDPVSGCEQVLNGITRAVAEPIFVKELSNTGGLELQIILPDSAATTVVVKLPFETSAAR
jgi:hypothetical protein